MGNRQDVIEINGKKYDALTGKLITGELNVASPIQMPKNIVKNTNTVMDGVVRKTTSNNPAISRIKKAPNTARTVQTVKKSPQKSATLMRTAVHKPKVSSTQHNTLKHPHQINKLTSSVPSMRLFSAENIKKSPSISKFGDLQHRSSVTKKIQSLPVKKPAEIVNNHPKHALVVDEPDQKQTKAPMTRSHAATMMIEKALENAKAHEQKILPAVKKKRKKLAHKLGVSAKAMAISSSVLAGVLLGGFFALQNVPNLSMRVAAARAGFNASMPNYHPSGFAFSGPINYSPGQVTISFRSNTDDRAYKVSQKASNWNSDALLSNYVVAENKQYQTYMDRGRTLFIYDGSNATWVDNGVWYQIEGDSRMTTDQLVRIAASI